MEIHFIRTGGFAAIKLEAEINGDALPPEETQALRDELETAQFFNLPARLEAPARGADRFEYEITVRQGDRIHTVTTGESAMPEDLQPLVQHLDRLARAHRHPG